MTATLTATGNAGVHVAAPGASVFVDVATTLGLPVTTSYCVLRPISAVP